MPELLSARLAAARRLWAAESAFETPRGAPSEL